MGMDERGQDVRARFSEDMEQLEVLHCERHLVAQKNKFSR